MSRSRQLIFPKSGISFGQNPNDESYSKVHIGISRGIFQEQNVNGLYRQLDNGFSIQEVTGNPETMADKFLNDLKRVGGPYGWDARKKYQPRYQSALLENMADTDTRLFRFYDNEDHVGFIKLSGIKRDWKRRGWEQGLNKFDAVNMFVQSEPTVTDFPKPIEFDKVGIFPEFSSRGYGKVMLAHLLRIAFEESDYNIVYLDTRNTNPVGVEDFYLKMGLRSFAHEKLDNDLVRKVEWPPDAPPPPSPEQTAEPP